MHVHLTRFLSFEVMQKQFATELEEAGDKLSNAEAVASEMRLMLQTEHDKALNSEIWARLVERSPKPNPHSNNGCELRKLKVQRSEGQIPFKKT